ncbi:hypothetical protein WK13_34865 [Burkholderia ubonensis]|uniref:phage tail tube protein n=1 Tax=Burkholderia ubonensis TaxID=101571 RepID=UPI00075A7889|nr:hypothetical protein [Burkholderia ubonensis]KVR21723.1 hypothetical protein WK13_34865 [Burkholderia ubonensis]
MSEVNRKWDAKDHYYSGQGVLSIAKRGADGKPQGFRAVGNVPDLKISVATTTVEHKESHSGQRATDKRLSTETKVTLSATLESWSPENLAIATRGESRMLVGGKVADEPILGYTGAVSALTYIGVKNVVLKQGETELVGYVDDNTPWDFAVNLDAGSVKINDGAHTALASLGVAATAVAVGKTTKVMVANSLAVGQSVSFYGFTGKDASALNGKTFTVIDATAADVTVGLDSTGKEITGPGKAVFDGMALTASYEYADQHVTDALTQPTAEVFMRFEGLNTAEDNLPVIVEIFKFSTDPLKELSMISDTFGQITLEGSVLSDSLRAVGSKFFNVRKLAV